MTLIFDLIIFLVIGLVAGYYRRLDLVVMRFMDGLMAFPAILLAIALMAGEIASLFLSRMAVPVLYFLANRSDETPTAS